MGTDDGIRSSTEIVDGLDAALRAAGLSREAVDQDVLLPWLEELEAKAASVRAVDFGTVWQTPPAFTQYRPLAEPRRSHAREA
jgi:hypothetical protein